MRHGGVVASFVLLAVLSSAHPFEAAPANAPSLAGTSVLVVLPSKTMAELEPMLAALEASGLKPRHVFPPDTVIVERQGAGPLPALSIPPRSALFEGPIDEIDRLAHPEI